MPIKVEELKAQSPSINLGAGSGWKCYDPTSESEMLLATKRRCRRRRRTTLSMTLKFQRI
jgi:hypothetical protein